MNPDLSANLHLTDYKSHFLKTTHYCYKSLYLKWKKMTYVHTNTHLLSSPALSPAAGCKRALLMFQPYLCKSHFAVKPQWSIALSISHSRSPTRSVCARHPQEFSYPSICLGQKSETLFPPLLIISCKTAKMQNHQWSTESLKRKERAVSNRKAILSAYTAAQLAFNQYPF